MQRTRPRTSSPVATAFCCLARDHHFAGLIALRRPDLSQAVFKSICEHPSMEIMAVTECWSLLGKSTRFYNGQSFSP
jgi:hypothetical protein